MSKKALRIVGSGPAAAPDLPTVDLVGDRGSVPTLKIVAPEDLATIWGLIRSGLAVVKAKTGAEWIPEDIYMAIRTGNAGLHVAYRGNKYTGFVVLSLRPNDTGKCLFVIAARTVEKGVIEEHMPRLVSLAKVAGANSIEFQTMRKGWGRRLRNIGFREKCVTYTKEINNG